MRNPSEREVIDVETSQTGRIYAINATRQLLRLTIEPALGTILAKNNFRYHCRCVGMCVSVLEVNTSALDAGLYAADGLQKRPCRTSG